MSRTPGTPRLLRAINDRAALSLLLEHGPLSRVQLGALTGLSKPTASQLLSRLEEAGLVVQVGTSAGGRGPNAALYSVNASAAYVAGMDVVAGRLTVAIADITGTVLAETAVETVSGSDTDAAVDVRTALTTATRRAGIRVRDLRGLIIGFPGAHDEVTDAVNYDDTLPNWARPGILGELRTRLGIRVEMENDVNLAAIAERRYGGLADIGSFALLWVSDGLGLAIDLGGELHRGATGGAGEIGYMPVPAPPPRPNPTRSRTPARSRRGLPGPGRRARGARGWPPSTASTPRPRRPRSGSPPRARTGARRCSASSPPGWPPVWPRSSPCSTPNSSC